jgi:hypothetical protein
MRDVNNSISPSRLTRRPSVAVRKEERGGGVEIERELGTSPEYRGSHVSPPLTIQLSRALTCERQPLRQCSKMSRGWASADEILKRRFAHCDVRVVQDARRGVVHGRGAHTLLINTSRDLAAS